MEELANDPVSATQLGDLGHGPLRQCGVARLKRAEARAVSGHVGVVQLGDQFCSARDAFLRVLNETFL
jgi:hypothetical protein